MVRLTDSESGQDIGTITDDQFAFLREQLEEESLQDQDYYIAADTVDMLESQGADPALTDLLRKALAGREGMDVTWHK